jgi:hypothetical protein
MIQAEHGLREKALIMTGESTGLRIGDILRLRKSLIEPLLNQEPPIGIEIRTTEKERVPAKPFLHQACVQLLKEYLTKEYPTNSNSDLLFVTSEDKPMNEKYVDRVIKRAFKYAGYNSGKLRVRFHCLRKFVIGRLQDAGVSESVWKLIVGKKTKEATYSTQYLREAYISALPRLDPTALVNNQQRVQELELRVKHQEQEIQTLRTAKIFELMNYFNEQIRALQHEAFKKSVPMSSLGKRIKPEAIKLDGAEALTLKALARVMMKLHSEPETK